MSNQLTVKDQRKIKRVARLSERLVNDVCCVCLEPIQVQIFRNSGVCCELHRKVRDNDHEPFKAVNLDVTKDGITSGE